MTANSPDYNSVEELIQGELNKSIHLECGRETSRSVLAAVRSVYQKKRCAFYLESDKGFERDTVRSYLKFFARLAGSKITAKEVIDHFGLNKKKNTSVLKLTPEERALMNFARMALFEPEVIFCERPLLELGPDSRSLFLNWIASETEKGTIFITVGEPLREALLMPGDAWWEEEGRFFPAQTLEDSLSETKAASEKEDSLKESDNDTIAFAGDEVQVCKVQAKAGSSTLLFDPREIDFIESVNRQIFVSVRGELYQTPSILDELEKELTRFGFFRCHRSYIVNVQRVAKVERFTRNSFNLTLSDVAHSSIPLAKGRAEEMRATLGMK